MRALSNFRFAALGEAFAGYAACFTVIPGEITSVGKRSPEAGRKERTPECGEDEVLVAGGDGEVIDVGAAAG